MTKGTIRVRDGVVVGVASEGEAIAYVHNGTLAVILKTIESEGWKPDGDLPPYRSTGEYTIPVVKN